MSQDKIKSRRPDEAEGLFRGSLGVIPMALVSYYRLSEEEARGAEEDLHVWFQRLLRRGGTGQMAPKLLRLSLLSATCQYGRSFQLWKLGGEPSADVTLNRMLAREPDEVANDLEHRWEEDRS
jgi:hypothetical protein